MLCGIPITFLSIFTSFNEVFEHTQGFIVIHDFTSATRMQLCAPGLVGILQGTRKKSICCSRIEIRIL